MNKYQCIIEGILFASGEQVSVDKIAGILGVGTETIITTVNELADIYEKDKRGIRIIRLGNAYQMCSADEYFEYIQKLIEPKRAASLSNAALEVLAVIAYNQPVSRSMIESIRGVECSSIVNKLLERGLVEEVGRLDAPGRAILFGTTTEFLRLFGISTLDELPDYRINQDNDEYIQQEIFEQTEFDSDTTDESGFI